MKTRTSNFAVFSAVFTLVLLLMQFHGRADSSPAVWQIKSRPCRIQLDWRPTDRLNPDEPAEIFFDTARLAAATGLDHLNPGSFTFVTENNDGSCAQIPFASRDELGQFSRQGTVFRFVAKPLTKRLWMYFGGADDPAPPLPTQWNLLEGSLDSASSWRISDPRVTATVIDRQDTSALHIAYDDKNQPADPSMHVAMTRSFPIPPECRGVEAKVAFDLKAICQGHVPLTILLQQFDASGRQLNSCIVDPRWLSMCVTPNQDIKLRELGYIYPATTSMSLSIGLWCPQTRDPMMNADGSWMQYPSSDNFNVDITRAELRAAHAISFPGYEKSRFSPGITGAEDDLSLQIGKGTGYCFDANPQAVWSEGALPSNPNAYHWPCAAGTFECWILPQFDASDTGERYILDAFASYGAQQSVLKIFYTPSTSKFHIVRVDPSGKATELQTIAPLIPGQWHHVACTWDPASGRQTLFVDGAPKLSHQEDPTAPIDITNLGSSKQIPGRVWLGQTNTANRHRDNALHGLLDEVRISDGVRYTAPFTPERAPFELDRDTRALFHFDGRIQGLAAGDDGRIPGTLLSLTPPTSAALEYEKQDFPQPILMPWDTPGFPDTVNPLKLFPVNPYVPLTMDAFTTSSIDRKTVLYLKPGETADINCASQPEMDSVEIRCPDDGITLARPLLAKPGEVDPRTIESILATLGISKLSTPRERADAIFKYLVTNNDYFWSVIAEIQPSGAMISPGEHPTIFFNSYLQFGCGEQNRMVRDFFLAAGLSADMTHGSGHVFEQVFFDGSWHLYDLFARVFFPARDNLRPAALSEVERDPYLAVRTERTAVGFWLPSDTRKYQFPDREIALPDMAYQLRPGESLRYYWHNDGRYNPTLINSTEHSTPWNEGPLLHGKPMQWANHFPPYTANGIFSFACTPRADHPALSDWHDGAFVYRFLSPYVICGAAIKTSSDNGPPATIELSFDEGKTWTPAPAASDDGSINLDKICTDRHLYWIRVTPPPTGKITHFEHQAIVLMNPKVLSPILTKGDNTIQFTANAGSVADISIQYHEQAGPLEIDGGSRFGWVAGHERQLLVAQPGKPLTLHVKQCNSMPSVIAPPGCETSVNSADDSDWQVDINIPANFTAGLFPLTISAGEQHRTAALLIAPKAQLITAEQVITTGNALIIADPDGVRGQVLQLNTGAEAHFPLTGGNTDPLALYALSKIPPAQPESKATLILSSGPAPFIEANFAHSFWTQENLLYQWKWYHVRAGSYPYETFAAVALPDSSVATIHCDSGQTLISAILALPAGNERLVEAVTQYLFSANYDPWMFQHDWGPIVTGVPYPQK